MIITKSNFFTNLSLLVLASFSLASSSTNCSNSSKIVVLGATALGAYLGFKRAEASISAKLDLDGSKTVLKPTDALDLKAKWELDRQKHQIEAARAGRKQDLEGLIASDKAGLFDIVRYRLGLY